MKILQLSESDISGGAARAGYRLHQGLQQIGINSLMKVQTKISEDESVCGLTSNLAMGFAKIKLSMDHLPKLLYRKRKNLVYHFQWMPDFMIRRIKAQSPDIIHLHWVCRAFINVKTLARMKKPLVWTFHDMWPFTGGCHYTGDCTGYRLSCGNCPQLGSEGKKDLSHWTWRRKQKWWRNLDLTIITPSQWMKACVLESTLLKDYPVKVIPYGIDLNRYRPLDRDMARDLLGLPRGKHLILFGAINPSKDPRKGFRFLHSALKGLSQKDDCQQTELIILGSSEPPNKPDFGFKTTYLGRLHDDISITLVYAACDVFVIPSLEDNLPNTVIEALACGIPCVGFNSGGISDMIKHKKNGYLAARLDIGDLANGIKWVLKNATRWQSLSREARKTVKREYDIGIIAQRYAELYQTILN